MEPIGEEKPRGRQLLVGETALKVTEAILHSADLVHPVLPWSIHRRLSRLVACASLRGSDANNDSEDGKAEHCASRVLSR